MDLTPRKISDFGNASQRFSNRRSDSRYETGYMGCDLGGCSYGFKADFGNLQSILFDKVDDFLGR